MHTLPLLSIQRSPHTNLKTIPWPFNTYKQTHTDTLTHRTVNMEHLLQRIQVLCVHEGERILSSEQEDDLSCKCLTLCPHPATCTLHTLTFTPLLSTFTGALLPAGCNARASQIAPCFTSITKKKAYVVENVISSFCCFSNYLVD